MRGATRGVSLVSGHFKTTFRGARGLTSRRSVKLLSRGSQVRILSGAPFSNKRENSGHLVSRPCAAGPGRGCFRWTGTEAPKLETDQALPSERRRRSVPERLTTILHHVAVNVFSVLAALVFIKDVEDIRAIQCCAGKRAISVLCCPHIRYEPLNLGLEAPAFAGERLRRRENLSRG